MYFYYKLIVDLIFWGSFLFAVGFFALNIYNRKHKQRRNIRHTRRIIKNWY